MNQSDNSLFAVNLFMMVKDIFMLGSAFFTTKLIYYVDMIMIHLLLYFPSNYKVISLKPIILCSIPLLRDPKKDLSASVPFSSLLIYFFAFCVLLGSIGNMHDDIT